MDDKTQVVPPEQIESAVLLIRGQRVMPDRDLAALYGVETKNLNRAVKRNLDRFPDDFMFRLTADEAEALRFQFGALKRGQHYKYLPFVFTQEGVAMLSSVLRSPRAAQVNIAIMRVFVRLRETLVLHKDLAHKLAQLERKIEGHDASIRTLFDAIRQLMTPPEKPRREIGFHAIPKDAAAPGKASKTQMKDTTSYQSSTASQPSGSWTKRFEEWLATMNRTRTSLSRVSPILFLAGLLGLTAPLHADPEMEWSSYLGGSSADSGVGIAVDGAGNVLVSGTTQSSDWTSGGFGTSFNGGLDAFVMKLSPSGAHLWSTYVGGDRDDYGNGIAVDSVGKLFVGSRRLSGIRAGGRWLRYWGRWRCRTVSIATPSATPMAYAIKSGALKVEPSASAPRWV